MSDSFPKSIELKKRSLHERIIVAKVLLESVFDDLPSVQPDVPDTNVGELISRQEAIKAILGEPPEVSYPIYYAEKIRELPSVQPEIIRCKDCKHYMQTDTIHHRGWCWRWNHFTAIERYCSERALRGDSDEN